MTLRLPFRQHLYVATVQTQLLHLWLCVLITWPHASSALTVADPTERLFSSITARGSIQRGIYFYKIPNPETQPQNFPGTCPYMQSHN